MEIFIEATKTKVKLDKYIADALRANGFKVTRPHNKQLPSQLLVRGQNNNIIVKLSYTVGCRNACISLYRRTERGGWRSTTSSYFASVLDGDSQKIADQFIAKAVAAVSSEEFVKDQPPAESEARGFKPGGYCGYHGDAYIGRTIVISAVRIVGMVAINEYRRISEEDLVVPDTKPWFHCDCIGVLGATFDIITDGDLWLPIDRRTHKVTGRLKPKTSVNLEDMNTNDQELLREAIGRFMA